MLATHPDNDMLFRQYISRLPYPPNHFQEAILRSLIDGGAHILVNALAGSGKTTLLVQAAQLLSTVLGVKPEDAMFLAFNKKIRDEMNKRLPTGWTAVNSHRLGNSLLKQAQTKTDVDMKKYWSITEELVKKHTTYKKADGTPLFTAKRMLENLCSKAMLSNMKLLSLTPEEAAAFPEQMLKVAEHFNLVGRDDDGSVDEEKEAMLEALIPLIPLAVEKGYSIWQVTGKVTFDEQIYLPVAMNLPMTKFKYIFIDEAQDLNALQQELVYRSCAPDGRMIFVGDKNQAIYGFASADAYSFDNIQKVTSAEVLPLNICYRCPPNHLEFARKIVPQIEAAPNAKDGIITYAPPTDAHKILTPGTLAMCRMTAPLVSTYFELIANRVPVKLLGRDIAKMLEGILDKVQKMPGFDYSRCIEYLEEYAMRQIALLQQKEAAESQVQQLNDSIECLTVCVENFIECHTMQCLRSELKKLFVEDDDEGYDSSKIVVLCTVHRAKGLEAERTAIIHPEKMPLVWNGQKPWEFEQERNILYVALTRSLKEMIIFGTPADLKVDVQSPADLHKNTRRQTDRPEDKIVDADVTDHLPNVKLQEDEEVIDWSKNRISKAEAFELAVLLREGALGDEGEAVEITLSDTGEPLAKPGDTIVVNVPEPQQPSNIISIDEINALLGRNTDADEPFDVREVDEAFDAQPSEEPPIPDMITLEEQAQYLSIEDELLSETPIAPLDEPPSLGELFKAQYGAHRIDGDKNPKLSNNSSSTIVPVESVEAKDEPLNVDPVAQNEYMRNRLDDIKQKGLFDDDEQPEKPKFIATGNLSADLKAMKQLAAQQPVEQPAIKLANEPAKVTPRILPSAPSIRTKRSKTEAHKAMTDALMEINDVSVVDSLIKALQAHRDMLIADGE